MDRATANDLVSGGPGSVELGGVTYLVEQSRDAHLAAFRGWLRKQIKTPLAAIAGDLASLPAELRAEAVRAAAGIQASGSEITREFAQEQVQTPAGCAFLLWLHAKKHHPELKLQDLQKVISEENVYSVLEQLGEATGMATVGKSPQGNSPGRTG